MSNVIRFLERIGSEARWGEVTRDEMELALAQTQVEDPHRSAILDKDIAQLQALLQQKPLISFIMPGEEEEDEEEESDQPGEKGPHKDMRCGSGSSSVFRQ